MAAFSRALDLVKTLWHQGLPGENIPQIVLQMGSGENFVEPWDGQTGKAPKL